MTKEEAINSFKKSNEQAILRIQAHCHVMDISDIRELEWYIERDKMAIKALEQKPKTEWIPVSDDTISRKDALDILDNMLLGERNHKELAIEQMKKLESIRQKYNKTNIEPCDDCISRAEMKEVIIDHQYSSEFCAEHHIDHSINTNMVLIALSDLPSVQPKTGQESKIDVLDKIRAEIVEAKDDAEIKFGHPLGYDRIATYDKCLQIIDKYRQEG